MWSFIQGVFIIGSIGWFGYYLYDSEVSYRTVCDEEAIVLSIEHVNHKLTIIHTDKRPIKRRAYKIYPGDTICLCPRRERIDPMG